MSNVSKAELETRLAEALEQMAEKERDLIMAAEFGQQLLEANARLQAQVEEVKIGGGSDGVPVEAAFERNRKERRSPNRLTHPPNPNTHIRFESRFNRRKKSESEHAKQVRQLESDLDSLRADFAALSQSAQKNVSSRVTVIEENNSSISENVISDLQAQIQALTNAKKEAEATVQKTTAALQESIVRLHDQEDRLQAAAAMRQEFERRGTLIIQLKDQVEDLSTRLQELQDSVSAESTTAATSSTTTTSKPLTYNKDWEWTPWIQSVKSKAFDGNLSGLKEEVEELKIHRQEAFNRLKEQMDAVVVGFVSNIPEGVRTNVLTPLQGVMGVGALAGSAKEDKEDMNIETITTMFPHVPVSAIEQDLAKTRSVRLTIENILNGYVAPTDEKQKGLSAEGAASGFSWTVANPDEE
ncbi:hypothetical protein BCR33DRAFT_355813 [Rhizoclosmatium globosum]|uniref:CUE domain-containing protein n=1 Tax=Rhizoclosmatium globosum TaxID=329046 RepID=A0A1Y2C192_9FUNG|nr:hypothetical protein BCR33DRAFT_355813 [Rhizoclosmatium globosum]|eukprot:ORY40647.1 hypothetical protein BCR33DRAFT_355813 [Rhizoclosmatium globosum]